MTAESHSADCHLEPGCLMDSRHFVGHLTNACTLVAMRQPRRAPSVAWANSATTGMAIPCRLKVKASDQIRRGETHDLGLGGCAELAISVLARVEDLMLGEPRLEG
jgi:hypothetical protein